MGHLFLCITNAIAAGMLIGLGDYSWLMYGCAFLCIATGVIAYKELSQ